jgi:multidrug resistance protein MdtO
MPRRVRQSGISQVLLQDLADASPGRLAGSLRDTLIVAIAVLAGMTLRVPGMELAVPLLFLMQRERPVLTLRAGVEVFTAAVAACVLGLLWVQVTEGSAMARFLGIMFSTFIAAFCVESTTTPLFWILYGFYEFIDLAAWDAHRSANAIVSSSLDNVAALGLVTLCALIVEYAFGSRHPAKELEREMKRRLQDLANFFRAISEESVSPESEQFRVLHHQLLQYGHAGDLYLNELYDRIRYSSASLSSVPLGIQYRIRLLARAMDKSVLLGFRIVSRSAPDNHLAYKAIAELCQRLSNPASASRTSAAVSSGSALASQIYLELQQYEKSLQEPDHPLPKHGFGFQSWRTNRVFLPGVFGSPDGALHALKLTLAACICYILYTAIAWPGILTCVVTVLVTGLTSTGAMKQKQAYRFAGALIGGLLGIAVVSLLYPNMDSIVALLCVISPVAFLAGWIMRSQRMGYVGYQIGLAFFLTALPGSSATTSISPARDRLMGIAVGVLVMWFVFDQLWPVRTTQALGISLLRIRQATRTIRGVHLEPDTSQSTRFLYQLRSTVSLELAAVQELAFAARFELGRDQRRELLRSRRLIREIETSSAEFYAVALQKSQPWSDAEARFNEMEAGRNLTE